jgi:hypothetical protein
MTVWKAFPPPLKFLHGVRAQKISATRSRSCTMTTKTNAALWVMAVAGGAAMFGQLPANAQEERFRLERTDDGYVRMDTRTGEMSLCREQDGRLTCTPTSDTAEGPSLQDRLNDLEKRVEKLEAEARPGAGLPSEEEFDQTLGMMERFFQRFIGIVKDLDAEKETPDPAPSEPEDGEDASRT